MSVYPTNMQVRPEIKAFFDPQTNTISYVVKDPASDSCAVVDSVMDIDYTAGRINAGHIACGVIPPALRGQIPLC